MSSDLFDTEAEEALLECVLLRPQQLTSVRQIAQPTDFTDPFLRAAYTAAVVLFNEGTEPNYVTVRARMRCLPDYDGAEWGARLLSLRSPTPNYRLALPYARIVHDLAVRRRIVVAVDEGRRNGLSGDQMVKAVIEAAGMYLELDQEVATA